MPRVRITVDGWRCARCGYEWIPRKKELPRVCSRCKSPYWDTEPKRKRRRAPATGAGDGSEGL